MGKRIETEWKYTILFLLLMGGCIGCNSGISGEIVPEWNKHSYKGQFEFTKHSHVVIKLYSEESADENPEVSTHRIEHINKFPIDFSIPLPDGVDVKKLRISAKVISGKGDETKEGDFVTETVTPVKVGGSNTITVIGLESCGAPHSGGFCSQNSKEK